MYESLKLYRTCKSETYTVLVRFGSVQVHVHRSATRHRHVLGPVLKYLQVLESMQRKIQDPGTRYFQVPKVLEVLNLADTKFRRYLKVLNLVDTKFSTCRTVDHAVLECTMSRAENAKY